MFHDVFTSSSSKAGTKQPSEVARGTCPVSAGLGFRLSLLKLEGPSSNFRKVLEKNERTLKQQISDTWKGLSEPASDGAFPTPELRNAGV